MSESYLPAGMPAPVPSVDGLDLRYWEGARNSKLMVQRCGDCKIWQWGPEWMCHNCNSFDVNWEQVEGKGNIYSWERPWHPVHPALQERGPYIVVLVELSHVGNIRMLGNLLGSDDQDVLIGSAVEAIFEHHDLADTPYTLVHWRLSK